MEIKKLIIKWFNRIINTIFVLIIVGVLYITVQVFLVASFNIPSDSMSPELIKGDMVLVWKPIIGPRLFNIFATMKGEQVNIHRIPGFRKIRRNDILVFNSPYPIWDKWDKIEMHILKYYIKRCIAIPGDTLSIQKGIYKINDSKIHIGNIESQKRIMMCNAERLSKEQFFTLPFDSLLQWNIKDFGPMYIPREGDILPMNRTNFLLYKKLIEWEQTDTLLYKNNQVFLKGVILKNYSFRNNYYFMGGDNCLNSVDSRFWGLVPENFIVGKAKVIWKSTNRDTNKIRWDRFLKQIY